jgi:DMSO/TMAO reductase YedYZ molybdopterin-dependent catalytic subunit
MSAILTTFPSSLEEVDYVEIRSYEGQPLATISDFRENSIRGPQTLSEEEYRLYLVGLVQSPRTYTYQQIITQFPAYQKVSTLHCVEGWSVTILWEGIRMEDLLSTVDIDPAATTVIFYAADGYSTALPLDYLYEQDILLAYNLNNVTLPAERGFPFQLVAESKWGYKWIKWITSIELSADSDYEGYWERRGFPNTADAP